MKAFIGSTAKKLPANSPDAHHAQNTKTAHRFFIQEDQDATGVASGMTCAVIIVASVQFCQSTTTCGTRIISQGNRNCYCFCTAVDFLVCFVEERFLQCRWTNQTFHFEYTRILLLPKNKSII